MIRRLRLFGWQGPEAGGDHMQMRNARGKKLPVPNPHQGDIDWSLMKRILKNAEINPKDWENAG